MSDRCDERQGKHREAAGDKEDIHQGEVYQSTLNVWGCRGGGCRGGGLSYIIKHNLQSVFNCLTSGSRTKGVESTKTCPTFSQNLQGMEDNKNRNLIIWSALRAL